MVAQPHAQQPRAESPLLTAALAYAARGWRVFPLLPNQKTPLIPKSRGGHGLLDATTESAQIRSWWGQHPRANIGLATGGGLIVLDVDLYKGADIGEWRLPPTLTAVSARGGQHLLYSYAEPLPCIAEGRLAPHVCVKATGGYIVAAPSTFQGKPYQWQDVHQPIAPLPERIAEIIRASARLGRAGDQEHQRQERQEQRQRGAVMPAADDAQRWLDWAMQKTGDGLGDRVGLLLAQQLIVNDVPDVEGTLRAYAAQATRNPADPFTARDVGRWISSAATSEIVRRGEPARSQHIAPTVTKRPHVETKASETAKSRPIPDNFVTDEADSVTEELEPEDAPSEPEDGDDGALLQYSADDNGNAEAMRHLYGREFLYTTAYGWLRWKGTHWAAVPDAIVERFAIEVLKRRRHIAVERGAEAIIKVTKCDRQKVTGCVALFRAYVIEPDIAVFDRDRDLLNCQNGVLNLRTGAITPHRASQRFTYCVPVDYNPAADMSIWRRYVLQAVGDDQTVADYLQTCAGYSITGHTSMEKLFYIYGPTRAGKGTFTETFLALLPHPLSEEVDFNSFTARRDNDSQNFDLAELKPARMVIASESNPHQSLNPAKIKQLTGGNKIRAAFKHKDLFSYRPQFKVWLVSNHRVNADAADDALWGRVQVICFPNSHLGAEDAALKERLQTAANLQGVLRWTVEGAQRWYREARLVPPASVVEATREHRQMQDYLQQWIDECCTLDAHIWTSSKQLLRSYQSWCELTGIKPDAANTLFEALAKRFGCTPKRQAGTGARGHLGIVLGVTQSQESEG